MAEIWSAALGAVTAAYGASQAKKAAKNGAAATQQANDASIAEQRRQYDQSRTDQMPFLQAGYGALGRQEKFLNGDWSGFQNAPDYKWAVDQGFQGLNRGLAASGGAGAGGFSGGADADRIALGQGLATQYANNYWSKLAGQAGHAQTSATNLGTLGSNLADQVGGYNQNTAQARASAYDTIANQNSALASSLYGTLGGAYKQYRAQHP